MPGSEADGKACAQFEAMLADAVDGLLTPEEQSIFDEHAKSCVACSVQLAEAQRGAAWLSMLKANPPEPGAALLDRILAETSVRTAAEQESLRAEQHARAEQVSLLGGAMRAPVTAPVALPVGSRVLPFRTRLAVRLRPMTHTVLQPRFMMTAAMAFFSIALTLNVTGVRLDQLHASDLKPSSLRRSFFQANAHVVRYYDNLRVVYELESRVHDLQHSAEDTGTGTSYPSAPATADSKQKDSRPDGGTAKPAEPAGKTPDGSTGRRPDPKSGSSRREAPAPQLVQVAYDGEGSRPLETVLDPQLTLAARESFGRAL